MPFSRIDNFTQIAMRRSFAEAKLFSFGHEKESNHLYDRRRATDGSGCLASVLKHLNSWLGFRILLWLFRCTSLRFSHYVLTFVMNLF